MDVELRRHIFSCPRDIDMHDAQIAMEGGWERKQVQA